MSVTLIFFVNLFQDVVNIFASVSDPDYPGHVILEQFQAQVRVVTVRSEAVQSINPSTNQFICDIA